MHTAPQVDRTTLAWLLSLLLHLFLLILFMQHKNTTPPLTPDQLQVPHPPDRTPEEEWVATRNSPQSNPIMLMDDPTQPQEPDTTPEPTPQQPEPVKPAPEPYEQDKSLTEQPEEIVPTSPEVLTQMMRSAQRITKKKKQHILPPQLQSPPAQQPTPVAKQPVRPQVALADLARDFMRIAAEEQAAATMHGTKLGHPSAEQLNRGRYFQKILECLVASYHSLRKREPIIGSHAPAEVRLVISRTGVVTDISFAHGSGRKDLDSYILSIFKDAATSFPPVPEAIAQDHYALSLRINDIRGLSSAAGWMLKQN